MSPMSWHLSTSALGSVVCSDNRGETICSELDISGCFFLNTQEQHLTGKARLWDSEGQGPCLISPVTYISPLNGEAKQIEKMMAEQSRGCSETRWKIQLHGQVNY